MPLTPPACVLHLSHIPGNGCPTQAKCTRYLDLSDITYQVGRVDSVGGDGGLDGDVGVGGEVVVVVNEFLLFKVQLGLEWVLADDLKPQGRECLNNPI